MLKRWLKHILPNPLDALLKRAQKQKAQTILIVWNRGLGDIALGIYAIVERIKQYLPSAELFFLTRPNLLEGFQLLNKGSILIADHWERSGPIDVKKALKALGRDIEQFDLILEKPDPTRWVSWQHGKVTPKLVWDREWDQLWTSFPELDPHEKYIGAHVQTETNYATWRNWPEEHWRKLFGLLHQNHAAKIVLFGFANQPKFDMPGVIDLRGKTKLVELLSIIKEKCHSLIVLDSGISSMTYFLNSSFPLHLISLWADPYMGILKQNVVSPNPKLKHTPLIGKNKQISMISPEEVVLHVCSPSFVSRA